MSGNLMNYKEFSRSLETIVGITVTPFHKDTKEMDSDQVKQNAEFLINSGLKVIVPCGNTSEFYSLTIDEAKLEIKMVTEQVDGRAKVVAGVGYAVKTAIELGNFAKEVGADGIMIHMPIHPYITTEGAVQYFKKIITSVDLPAVVYFKDPNISDEVLLELSSMDKLVGIKYAINDLPRFAKTFNKIDVTNNNVAMICGTAEKWAPFFYQVGARGFTSGLVNLYPEKSFALLEALENNDNNTIWEIWNQIVAFEDLRAKYNSGNNVVVIKEAMELVGLNGGVTREPVAPLKEDDKVSLRDLINSWGLNYHKV
ncbi:dihydrodipicolinate synthase family protein [Evansella sp. AB-rgal1]|uniref:dihydrodipicolinate synthase family protein n=1 Tax=Evansella sp. AB-rgal1 TaxID=3242696 RepID=UPI00359E99FD